LDEVNHLLNWSKNKGLSDGKIKLRPHESYLRKILKKFRRAFGCPKNIKSLKKLYRFKK
jgi:hypothetical protein